MAENNKHVYDESKIKTLSSLEHIRLRTGMYIGRIGDGSHYEDGCYILLKEVIDNAIDEFIMGAGREVQIDIQDRAASACAISGAAFPSAKWSSASPRSTPAPSITMTSSSSASASTASAPRPSTPSRRSSWSAASARGNSSRPPSSRASSRTRRRARRRTSRTAPSSASSRTRRSSRKSEFLPEHVEQRLRHYSYLNSGLKLLFNGKTFQSRNGLLDLVMEDLQADGSEPIYPPLHYAEKTLEFCFTHSNSRYGETFYSFVNGQYTTDGGTHLSAFREGLLKAVNEYGHEKFEGDDVRESMVGAVAIRLKDPVFESQTKNKLGNTEIRTDLVNRVREELLHFFNRNKDIAEKIIAKVQDTRQLRKELQEVKKLARERAKAITIRIPQLKDCKVHFDKAKGKGKGSMVFLTEGQSAAGSIVSCRDVNTQAIFVLKGKPLNVWDLKRDIVYKNDEMYNLMRSLDIEDNLEGPALRKGDPGHRCGRGRPPHPQLAHHLFLPVLRPARPRRALVRAGDAAVPRAQQGADHLLLLRSRAGRGGQEPGQELRDHAVQGPG